MDKLKIEYVKTDSIFPYMNNAKIHTVEQIAQIKQSIMEFSFNDPIAVWNDEIIEGHGRLAAAKELNIKEVPIIRLDSLTDEQRRAYMLVHNKLTMNTGFDDEILYPEIENITDIDLSVYGFELDADMEAEFDNNTVTPEDSEYKEPNEQYTECPNCGMRFVPILKNE